MIKRDLNYVPAKGELTTYYKSCSDIYDEAEIVKLFRGKGIMDFFIYKEEIMSKYAGMPGHPIQNPKYPPNTHNLWIAHPNHQDKSLMND